MEKCQNKLNKWKIVKTTLLTWVCQIYSKKLPKRLLTSFNFNISLFEAVDSQIFKFLYSRFFTVLVNKYWTKASLLAETQSSYCQRITALPR